MSQFAPEVDSRSYQQGKEQVPSSLWEPFYAPYICGGDGNKKNKNKWTNEQTNKQIKQEKKIIALM